MDLDKRIEMVEKRIARVEANTKMPADLKAHRLTRLNARLDNLKAKK